MPALKHAILGVGGVGGLMGASLARLGDSVTLVLRRESLATYPEQLKLESPFGNFSVPVTRSAEVPPVDVLWLTVKATQLDALAALTHPESVQAIVPLLNGIDHLDWLRSKYGFDRVIPATIAVESERVAPGHIIHRSPFARLNVLSAGRTLLASTLDQFQKLGFECRFIDDEPTLMWSKAVFLAPIALATTAFDQPIGGVMSNPDWKAEWESSVREACAVATAEGAKVDPTAVFTGMSKMPYGMRSSMQKDVEQGNPPELDAIAGPIIRAGDRRGIEITATKRLLSAVAARVLPWPSDGAD
ncbi:MAG TPA: 2-dehydropantoate 2-reductase [Candidatus Binatia bacterium]|nr:2-dehydropantoate 2-reductase [Candidatus Binatia bacterium]